jgi:hypothetical protein
LRQLFGHPDITDDSSECRDDSSGLDTPDRVDRAMRGCDLSFGFGGHGDSFELVKASGYEKKSSCERVAAAWTAMRTSGQHLGAGFMEKPDREPK